LKFLRRLLPFLLVLAAPLVALALNPDELIRHYGHSVWRLREGYFAGGVFSLAQTKDGYMWIGTDAGLLRFDGVRFEPWHPPAGMSLPHNQIAGLLGASDGSLWIGTGSGLARWADGKITVYTKFGRFGIIVEGRNGTIWAGHTRSLSSLAPLCSFAKGEFHCFGEAQGLPFRWVEALKEDAQGNLWIGGNGGVCKWAEGKAECFPLPSLSSSTLSDNSVRAIAFDKDGTLWAGAGAAGIWQLSSGVWKRYRPPQPIPADVETESMLLDSDGSLWIGASQGGATGLMRVGRNGADTFSEDDGLSGENTSSIFEDREGNIWVGTASGLDCFRNAAVVALTRRDGVVGGGSIATLATSNKELWVSDTAGLTRFHDGKIETWVTANGLPGHEPTSLFKDSTGRLWVGIDNGLAWYENGHFSVFEMSDGTQIGVVRAMAEDRDGSLWISTTIPAHALLRVNRHSIQEIYTNDQIGTQQISAMAIDLDGGLWLGDISGLIRFKNGKSLRYPSSIANFAADVKQILPDSNGIWLVTNKGLELVQDQRAAFLNVNNGLPCDALDAAIKSNDDSFWLHGSCGLMRVSVPELKKWIQHPDSQIQVRTYDSFDGATSGGSPFSPRSTKSPDGRLWFAIDQGGLMMVNPAELKDNTIVPPVKIVQVVADHKAYENGATLDLPPRTRDLEIDYTALSFTVPQKVRFRYKLEGLDTDWQDAGTRREAFYNNLRPGHYTFRVIACNNDGLWNETGAAKEFSIAPAFFQTTWFGVLCIACVAGILWMLYLARMRQVTSEIRARLEERTGERERIARELHDTLLQSIQGLLLKFHAAVKQIPPEQPARKTMEMALDRADEVLSEGRDRVRNLRDSASSLQDLSAAFRLVAQECSAEDSAEFNVVVEGEERTLHPMVLEESYLVGREAIVNAFNHSGGRHIEVEITYGSKEFRLRVRDDGRGIDPSLVATGGREDHWGLPGMRERAQRIGGHLDIWSGSERGTELELRVPAATAYQDHRMKSKWLWFERPSEKSDG
jgi:signal transduction histidine kinase/ligand-binding sensor domain-containing protein